MIYYLYGCKHNNHKSSSHTIKLVKSILDKINPTIKYEIIITDNASYNNDYKELITKLPKVKKIKIFR